MQPSATAGKATEAQSPQSWQFRTGHLFLYTAAVAVVSALGVGLGVGVVPLAAGMVVAFLSLAGLLVPLQHEATRPKWVSLAWLLFAVSMLMPASEGCGSEPIRGWQAAWTAATAEVDLGEKVLLRGKLSQLPGLIFFTLLNVANILMVLSPWMLRRIKQGKGHAMATGLAVASVGAWIVPIDISEPLLSGYYVWAGSFMLMLLVYPMRLGVFVTMGILAAFFIAYSMLE